MRAVDTNVVVRLIVRDDPEQVDRAEAFVARGAWISLLVLAETLWVLQSVYGLSRQRLGTVVDMLMEHDRLTLQQEEVVRKARAAFESGQSAGFSDCLIVEAARQAGHTPVGTFDKAMSRLDGAHRLDSDT